MAGTHTEEVPGVDDSKRQEREILICAGYEQMKKDAEEIDSKIALEFLKQLNDDTHRTTRIH